MAATPTFSGNGSGAFSRHVVGRSRNVASAGGAPRDIVALVEWDPDLRRLWVAGQRLHHGATGIALAWASASGLVGKKAPRLAIMVAGGALMAHDWKDRSIWFQRGHQDQPAPEPKRRDDDAPARSFRLQRRSRRRG